jgi:hypothetical protein
MSIWNKVLVWVIGVLSLPLFYLGARTLKTHQYWRELAIKHQRKIDDLQRQNRTLIDGGGGQGEQAQLGIRQRRIELSKLLLDRRRVWTQCDPKVAVSRDKGTAEVSVTLEQPNPHGIAKNTILYGFEEADANAKEKKGRYLGEFKVTKADEKAKTVTLEPTLPLNPRELERLATAQKPWNLYEVLPHNDPDSGPVHDYQVLLTALNAQRTLLIDQIEATTRDKKLVDDALAQAQQQEEGAKQDVDTAKEEAKRVGRQRDAVATYRKTLEHELEAVKADIARLMEQNKAMAGQIAKQQWEATRRIDERSRTMAQSRTGG